MLNLIGMRIQGVHKDKSVKGMEISNTVTIAITLKDFQTITKSRNRFL
jgi:hypothetical protein